jgi:hypothetical protein
MTDPDVTVADLPDVVRKATHDLNNQLGVVLNYALLLGRQVADETAKADLVQISTAAEKAVAISRSLDATAAELASRAG